MIKKKKLFEPIRRGAPSLPFDFTDALKKIEAENEEVKNIQKLIDECKQKMIEITGIPKDKINYKKCRPYVVKKISF